MDISSFVGASVFAWAFLRVSADFLSLAILRKNVSTYKGGIEELVPWTNLSPQTLTYLLNTEHPPPLDKVLDILDNLKDSFHLKHVVVDKDSTT